MRARDGGTGALTGGVVGTRAAVGDGRGRRWRSAGLLLAAAVTVGAVSVVRDAARLRTGVAYRPLAGGAARTAALDAPGVTPLDRIAPVLVLAVVANEDRHFFRHHGFDVAEMRAALRESWRSGRRLRGASTISQQLVKNVFCDDARTVARKLQEAAYTAALEATWSKAEILTLYLDQIEFGDGIYGVTAATRRYFHCEPADVTLPQAALLASVLPAPRPRGRGVLAGSMPRVGTFVVRRRLQRLRLLAGALAPGRALRLDDVVAADLGRWIDPAEANGYPASVRRAAHRDYAGLRRAMRAGRFR